MTDRDDRAADSAVPGPRHAAPRVSTRSRLRGRALAIAAVPTALLMGTIPTLAMADTQKSQSCASAPDTVIEEIPVPKSDITPVPGPPAASVPGPSQTQTQAPTQVPTKLPTQRPSAPASAPATSHPTAALPSIGVAPRAMAAPNVAGAPKAVAPAPAAPSASPSASPSAAPSASPSASASAAGVQSNGIIGDILDGILHPGGGSSPSPTPPAAPAPAPTQTPTQKSAPTPPPAPTTPGATTVPEAPPSAPAAPAAAATGKAPADVTTGESAAASAGAATTKPGAVASSAPASSPTASPTKDPNCQVDARSVSAASTEGGRIVPDQNWTLRSSVLGLHGAVFHGVVDVRTPTTTKRVLKFVVDSVDIGDLDMSTLEGNGKTFHVKGGPGTTSTMREGQVTMYVESLSGHLSKVLGLPIPIDLGQITLTPNTLPQWLYDLIGSVPIPLDLEMKQVTAIQAGQFGGTLTIPRMHMYNDDTPY